MAVQSKLARFVTSTAALEPVDDGVLVLHRVHGHHGLRGATHAGHLQVRDSMNGLPGPNKPVDFDKGPFVTTGLGPKGETVMYYNFDVQSTTPAPIYVLFRAGESSPVVGQLNVVDVTPGDSGYNDFWQINKVTVPADYKRPTRWGASRRSRTRAIPSKRRTCW